MRTCCLQNAYPKELSWIASTAGRIHGKKNENVKPDQIVGS